ncbi:MAG: hypothetical protein GX868_07455 [Actinobacteria bacterium]|nr:hypothetical protein [Actinomycetota bacterium]
MATTTSSSDTKNSAPKNSAPARSLLDRTDSNRDALRTVALPHAVTAGLAFLVVVTVVVGLLSNWLIGLLIGAVAGGVAAFVALRQVPNGSRAKIDAAIPSRPAPEDEFPRYHNLIEGLTLNSGAKRPELRVVDDPSLNLAVYGSPDDGVVVATTGLLHTLERIELEGVLAAALVRLRAHDAELGMQLAAIRSFGLLDVRADDDGLASKERAAASLANVLHAKLGEQREFLGDLGAVDITRYPPGLGGALMKMETVGTTVASATVGTAHLWLADPLGTHREGVGAALEPFRPQAPMSQRIMLMEEL